jgi:hypothetical protein
MRGDVGTAVGAFVGLGYGLRLTELIPVPQSRQMRRSHKEGREGCLAVGPRLSEFSR